ncbi:MAG: HAMP domain-containing histidine kinase [Proteobacteria bacterium]|nr:HAMP domain-containing histidine kinase [Pseudomonadota bacterium]
MAARQHAAIVTILGAPARIARSLAGKFAILLVIFAIVPLILYGQFRVADEEKRGLVLNAVGEQGRLIAQGLAPLLRDFGGRSIPALNDALARFGGQSLRIKLLLRAPGTTGSGGFYYIAAYPRVSGDYLEKDRTELIGSGVLARLGEGCTGDEHSAQRYRNPAGEEEVLTSLTPVSTDKGCWAVITSHTGSEYLGSTLGRSYWQSREVRLAAFIYLLMAALVAALFLGLWRNLQRFARLAQRLSAAPPDSENSFAALNRVPELSGIASEFDRMVDVLRRTAGAIRHAAEENVHALKTPIGIIAQSLDPIRRALPAEAEGARSACDRVERSVERLDALVSAARRMEEVIAESMSPPRARLALSDLLARLLTTFEETMAARGVRLERSIEPGLALLAGEETIEAVIENLLENALGFSPAGRSIRVTLRKDGRSAELWVEDEGPGVEPANLDRIFERYYSHRPSRPDQPADDETHFGIGLWIVRRNVESLGGSVRAENRPEGGLRVRLRLPLA